MATLLRQSFSNKPTLTQFNLNDELNKHAWRPYMDADEATKALQGKPAYTYLLRTSLIRGKFEISFVQTDGSIKHDQFSLVNPRYGIWRNGQGSHLGTLAKVIRDMMHCQMHIGQPLD